MSVFKRAKQDSYSYDFRVAGVRYSGNTNLTTKREAEQYEQKLKRQAKERDNTPIERITMGDAVLRFWEEVGQFHANSDTTLSVYAWLQDEIGKRVPLADISSNDIARAIAKRREPDKKGRVVEPSTVNRTVTQPMRALLNRANNVWGVPTKKIVWSEHMLKEPQERVRELTVEEERCLFDVLRDDYHPIVYFALLTGCRMQECLDLRWRDIDWRNSQFRVTGKGSKTRTIPLSSAVYELLKDLPRAADVVFTYKNQRVTEEAPRGAFLPMKREGLKSIFERAVIKAKLNDFHFHDLRHTCATRLLRATGNLRIVKELLGHEDIATTLKYAHVSKDDIAIAMEEMRKLKR